jgi:hypothetical protein
MLGLAGSSVRIGQIGAIVGCFGRISKPAEVLFVDIDVDAIARQSGVHLQASQAVV